MNNHLVALSVAVLGAAVFVPSAKAQGHVAFAPGPGTRASMAASPDGGMRTGFVRRRRARRFYTGSGYAPYFYSDYDSDSGDAPPPQIFIMQTAQPASPAPTRQPPESLVLELRGDHWVRITNYGQSQTDGQWSQPEPEQASNLAPAPPPATPRRTQAAAPPSELPPAVLVFRDGHKEEVGKYMIKGATIYTSTDYWSSGSWTRKVQIAELDVPQTLKLNQERDARFSLPSGPNEVMIRP
jgi:hypothetical protein